MAIIDIMYYVIGITTSISIIIIIYFKWSFQYWRLRNVPFFEPTIPWGSLCAPHKRIISLPEEVTKIYNVAKDKGWKHFGIFFMTAPVYVPTDLDIIKCILTKDFSHFVDRGIYINEKDDPLSAHLFAVGGKKWKYLRTMITPTLSSGKIKAMFQIIADCGTKLENYLEHVHHRPVDIKNVLADFTIDVIGSTAFGLVCNSFTNPSNQFRIMGNKGFRGTRIENIKFTVGLNFPKLAKLLGFRVFNKNVTDFFSKVVKDAIAYREENNVQRKDFLQLLIDIRNKGNGNSLTLNDIMAQSFVFFLAGYETSATTLTFTLYELSRRQDVQDKVREEIRDVLNNYNGEITYDALNDMKYLSQVIDETLRKHPPVPFITRVCVEDYTIPNTNLKIKKGVKIFIPIKGIHYDKEYFKNPETFDPERFSDENRRNRNQYTFMPFGEGPRICIGMRFGIVETKVGLVNILKKFRVSLNEKTKLPLDLVPNSFVPHVKDGIWLNMEKL